MTRPVMLYFGKIHHSHKAMAESIDAELIQIDAGNPMSRLRAAWNLDLGDRPVITEGGIPLFQAAWMKQLGNCGPVIHLAADEALMNIFTRLGHYSWNDRLAHKWAHRYVDAVLGVSPRLVSEARALGIDVVKLIHPFPDEWKWETLGNVKPDLSSHQVLAVGSLRAKNNFAILQDIADLMEEQVHFNVIGPETDEMADSRNVITYGFVPNRAFIEFYESASATILPAISQPFPVSTLESMRAGLPPFVTTETGTSCYIQKISPRFVHGISAEQFAKSLDWYFSIEKEARESLSDQVEEMGKNFNPGQGKETFQIAYGQTMEELGWR